MRRLLSSLALTSVLALAQTFAALDSDRSGWQDITPAAGFSGWSRGAIPPTEELKQPSPWKRVGVVVLCEGDKAGHEWLRWDRELTDFIFHVEWRLRKLDGSPRYNSGVFIRNAADAGLWLQAQVGSASGGYLFGDTLLKGEKKRVNLRDQVKDQRVKPAGHWNAYEIRARGARIELWVNGAVTCRFDQCEVLKGYVGMEAEGYPIEFRNLKLKVLH